MKTHGETQTRAESRRRCGLVISAGCALALLAMTGCQSTPKVNTQARSGADFSRYHTFALLPLPQRGPASDPGLMLRLADPARQAVVDSLTSKGFAEVPDAQADFNVHLHGQSVPKVDVTQLGYSRPVLTHWGTTMVVTQPETMVNEYEERTLTVEVLDTRSKEVVWVGWATSKSSGPVKLEGVTNVIHQILAQFPPPPAGGAKP